MTLIEHTVRERAYYIWEEEGRVHGRADAHWLRAEAEIAAPASILTVQAVAEASLAPSPAKTLKPRASRAKAAVEAKPAKVAPSRREGRQDRREACRQGGRAQDGRAQGFEGACRPGRQAEGRPLRDGVQPALSRLAASRSTARARPSAEGRALAVSVMPAPSGYAIMRREADRRLPDSQGFGSHARRHRDAESRQARDPGRLRRPPHRGDARPGLQLRDSRSF